MRPRKRPAGITLIAFSLIWLGVGMTVIAPFAFGVQFTFSTPWDEMVEKALQRSAWLPFTIFSMRAAQYLVWVAFAIIGFGLWKLHNWARKSLIGFLWILALAQVPIELFTKSRHEVLIYTVWSIPFCAWPTWYLLRPRVRFAFSAPIENGLEAETALPPPKLSTKGRILAAVAAVATLILMVAVI